MTWMDENFKEGMLQQANNTYSDHVLGGLELPEGDIDGDTTLTLGLQLVEHPSYRLPLVSSKIARSAREINAHHT